MVGRSLGLSSVGNLVRVEVEIFRDDTCQLERVVRCKDNRDIDIDRLRVTLLCRSRSKQGGKTVDVCFIFDFFRRRRVQRQRLAPGSSTAHNRFLFFRVPDVTVAGRFLRLRSWTSILPYSVLPARTENIDTRDRYVN